MNFHIDTYKYSTKPQSIIMAEQNRRVKALIGQFQRAIKLRNEYVKFYMNPMKVDEWWVLIHNISGKNDEFKGGEFLVKLVAPDEFPDKPPGFHFMTPTGIFAVEGDICISIGKYHANNYRPVLGMHGFADEIMNSLVTWKSLGHGIGIEPNATLDQIRLCTSKSRAYNTKYYADKVQLINESFAEYSKKWAPTSIIKTPEQELAAKVHDMNSTNDTNSSK